MTLSEPPVRRYTAWGKVAHLLPFTTDFSAAPYTQAACGVSPIWPWAWYGSGSQDEHDKAAALPLCKTCERKTR